MSAWLTEIADRRYREFYMAAVMAIGFLTFYGLPDGIPFLVRLAMMVATQIAVGQALRQEERRCI